MSKVPKILFVVNVDWFFLSHRLPIALGAINHGYQVYITTGITTRLDELKSNGLIVYPLDLDRSSTSLWSTFRTIFQLWSIFRAVKPDIVHLVTIKPVLFGGLMARLAGIPAIVAAVSGLGYVYISKGITASIRRWFVGLFYGWVFGHQNIRIIFQNSDDKERLNRVVHLPVGKVSIIRGSGVDLIKYRDRKSVV